jgi:choline dehydrogenase-like flavoprotein
MVWILGNRKDFDGGDTGIGYRKGWGEENEGWKWKDLEGYWGYMNEIWRNVQLKRDEYIDRLILAGIENGYEYSDNHNDLSGIGQGGISQYRFSGYYDSINICNGSKCETKMKSMRASSWTEFGKVMLKRDNLDLLINHRVEKLNVENNKVVSVLVKDLEYGKYYTFEAKKGICASWWGYKYSTNSFIIRSWTKI